MAIDDDDVGDTKPSTPNAKKSSGEWRLNLDGALCARFGCGHRRDEHLTRDQGSHRWECSVFGCVCAEFVIGGPENLPDYSGLEDTVPESTP